MSQGKPSVEAVISRAADWLSTALSIPLIWPKSSAAAAIGAILVSGYLTFQSIRPGAAAAPRPSERRVADIRETVREAAERYRSQASANAKSGAEPGADLSDAVLNPDHWRKHNESPRIHAD